MDKLLLFHSSLQNLQQHLEDKSAFSTENPQIQNNMAYCHNCTYQAHTRGYHQPAYLDQGPWSKTNHVLNVVVEAVGTLATNQHRDKVKGQIIVVSFNHYSHKIPTFFILSIYSWQKHHYFNNIAPGNRLFCHWKDRSVAKYRWRFLTSALSYQKG